MPGNLTGFVCHSAQYFLVFPSRSYLASLFPSSFFAVSLLLLSWYVSFLPFPVSCCQSRAVTKLGEMTKTIFNSTLWWIEDVWNLPDNAFKLFFLFTQVKKLLAVPAYEDAKSVCLYLSLPTEVKFISALTQLFLSFISALSQLANRGVQHLTLSNSVSNVAGRHWGACLRCSSEEQEVLRTKVQYQPPMPCRCN